MALREGCVKRSVIQLHQDDPVAVAVRDLAVGDVIEVNNREIEVQQPIPRGHKVAVVPVTAGRQVRKYGHVIGQATENIAPGQHVHVHNVRSGRGTGAALAGLPVGGGGRCPEVEARSNASFWGYRRPDGRIGVRNHVLVMAGVHCANGVVERIARAVPEVVALPHIYGCSQLGEDLRRTVRILSAYLSHPNVASALFIGLGCETLPTREIAQELCSRGYAVECLLIQEVGGSRVAVDQGGHVARRMLAQAAQARRVSCAASELVVGVECGGSDAWSGVTANPVVGEVADMLVAEGGRVILSEVTEFIGAEHLLVTRAVSPEVARQVIEAVVRRERVAAEMGEDLRGAQPTPGNMDGGLSTIEEKSLGAILKGGESPIREFLAYGERPSQAGLAIMDTAGNDLESVSAMVAGGAQLILFTTGRGTPAGNPIAPVIKVASNCDVWERLRDDLDFSAGPILSGESLSALGDRLWKMVLDVASGETTAAERWGHREFAIEPLGPRV